jgi:DNA-binding MarR family transcriptional regulator
MPGLVLAQGRVFEAVAGGLVLSGTAEALARRLGVRTGNLRAAVRELRAIGWIAVRAHPDGRLTVRLERRARQVPVAVERRAASRPGEPPEVPREPARARRRPMGG